MSPEERFPIKPEGVRYICENCQKGEMKYDPDVNKNLLDMGLNLYPHKCTNCGIQMDLPKVYPYIEWIPLDKEGGKEIGKDVKCSDDE